MNEYTEQEMVSLYLGCAMSIDPCHIEQRTNKFCNAVSQLAFDDYGLNMADTTIECDAFHTAIELHFSTN